MDGQQQEGRAMCLVDQSAEYYRLREGHERALALAAKMLAADRYAALASDLRPESPQ